MTSDTLNSRIPANLREPEGNWYGFSRRARIVAYDPAKVRPEEIDDYADLATPRFRGKICIRSSDSVYNLSLVGALALMLAPERGDTLRAVKRHDEQRQTLTFDDLLGAEKRLRDRAIGKFEG